MTESAIKTAMRLNVDMDFAFHLESRLKNPSDLEEAIRMFYAGTLPYSIVYNSDSPIDLQLIKSRFIENMMKRNG